MTAAAVGLGTRLRLVFTDLTYAHTWQIGWTFEGLGDLVRLLALGTENAHRRDDPAWRDRADTFDVYATVASIKMESPLEVVLAIMGTASASAVVARRLVDLVIHTSDARIRLAKNEFERDVYKRLTKRWNDVVQEGETFNSDVNREVEILKASRALREIVSADQIES